MGSDLCKVESTLVKSFIVEKFRSASSKNLAPNFTHTIAFAVASPGWGAMIAVLNKKAAFVGSDLDTIWMGLETGRMEWLTALNNAHSMKTMLKEKVGDTGESLMVYMYALAVNIPCLTESCGEWAKAVEMEEENEPLRGYKSDLWDSGSDIWKSLDVGVQKAAERGGDAVVDAWKVR